MQRSCVQNCVLIANTLSNEDINNLLLTLHTAQRFSALFIWTKALTARSNQNSWLPGEHN